MRKVAVLSFIMVIAILLGLNGWLVLHPVYAVDEQTHCTAKCKEPCKEVECIGDNCGATDNVGCYATSGGQINIKQVDPEFAPQAAAAKLRRSEDPAASPCAR